MGFTEVRTVWTVLSFVVFVAILVWAYSGRARRGFDAAAQLPFADDVGEAKGPGVRVPNDAHHCAIEGKAR